MLPRKYRLSKQQFAQVKQGGRLVSGDWMAILLGPRGRAATPAAKAGLIVSRKISLHATVRNKLKRRLRAALVEVLPHLSPEINLIVLPRQKATEATVGELKEELEKLLIADC